MSKETPTNDTRDSDSQSSSGDANLSHSILGNCEVQFAFAVNAWKNTTGGAYYDPSNGIFYIMEDTVDARGGFEVIIMLLQQIVPEVVLLSSKAEESLDSSIQNAGEFLNGFQGLHDLFSTYTLLAELGKPHDSNAKNTFGNLGLTNQLVEIPGGIDNALTIIKRPSREYSASDGLKKLQQLSVRSQDGIVLPGGGSSPSSTGSDHELARDVEFNKNSHLTASSFVNIEATHYSLGAVAALLSYLQSGIARSKDRNLAQRGLFVSKVEMIKTQKFMHLGNDVIQSLQIFDQEAHANLHFSKTKEGLSLYGILNECITHNGKLLLRNWLLRPSTELKVIESRQDAIECFLESENADYIGKMRQGLKSLGNINRTTMIISSGKARVGEWSSLIKSIHACQALYDDFSKLKISTKTPLFTKMRSRGQFEKDLEPLASQINEMIDWPESKLNGGRVTIRPDIDEKLDDYREQYSLMESQLSSLSEKICKKDPFNSLPGFSLNYFPQIGFLCAIPFPAQSGSVDPSTIEDWEFRFATDIEEHYKNGIMRDLDHHYGDLATAIDDREIELVHQLEEEVSKYTSILLTLNDDLAELDCLLSLAKVTFERAWVRPEIVEQNTVQLTAGRHPLVESCVESYIPNDTHLVANSISKHPRKKRRGAQSYTGNPMIILTGANFSGKSVYLKQVAIIVILAQLGSFVPAEEAHIGIHDAVFTRVSTTESASRSSSAFMIDLQRISFMLRNCTARSIILIDEFGKGTDPTDGQALFCGVVEHLISRGSNCPIALVSTHFHGVFTNGFLSLDLPIDYAHMSIVLRTDVGSEEDNTPTYLYKLAPGLVSSSHAMGCAAQAGIPRHIRLKADRVSLLLSRFEILELLDVQLEEDEREELGIMEQVVRRFVAVDFEPDGSTSSRDWMTYLRENVLNEGAS
ncbi:hypothetical protein KEM48_005354 [Puccinia striiformis f. sp. tritici PST-130]|uniref:DNA mismatch repair proteins mutS family domain-containing protein n=1 Tax=Puccinia striiformis TaxID=27350 RepID=A0A2S4V2I9_9BASI|nr:hypothetical protein KEM48_005354 [Puccinia striiformis f. sp. tritici PST-130]POW03721.1 hypothetical protein PSTT_10914 [Puccinia striiformis]